MNGGNDTIRMRPHPWYLATIGVITFLSGWAVITLFDAGSSFVPIAAAIGSTTAIATTMVLHLDPTGLRIQHGQATWDQLALTRGPFGHRLRMPVAVEPRRRHRVKLFLPMWELDWRSGAIGRHLERYAPHLLAELDAS